MPDDDRERFEAVFDRCFAEIYGYVAYRLAPDRQLAGDITQDVFLAAWQNWSTYRGDGPPAAWLRAIARHKVADHLRARGLVCETVEAQAPPAVAGEARPDPQLLLLAQAMPLLPAQCVDLLEEKYLEGLAVRQIAEKRGRTEKSIESALSRARDQLRRTFQRLQAGEEIGHENLRL